MSPPEAERGGIRQVRRIRCKIFHALQVS